MYCKTVQEEEEAEEQEEQEENIRKENWRHEKPVDTNRKPFNRGDCFSLPSKLNKRGFQKDAIVVHICCRLKLRLIFNTALSSRTKYNLCCDCYHLVSAFPSFGIPDELKPFSSPRSTLTLPSRQNPTSNFKFAVTKHWQPVPVHF
jgi:hypothetical protein